MEGADHLLERDEARGRLSSALAAARKGQGRVVSLEGEAGIGKSALTIAFVETARQAGTRVHVGGCEHLSTPEPLGPLRDIARESQGRFAISALGQIATFEALLRLLTGGKGPALLVLEDIHWADDATLDALRYLGRRIRTAPVMVLVTFRNDEPESRARLASLWADMPRDARDRIELSALSMAAVTQLAHDSGRSGREVFEACGGNPFHVTEYLEAMSDRAPRAIEELTVQRAARLGEEARRTLECASIFPRQIDEEILLLISGADHAGVEECLAGGMLVARGEALAFRHELARRAINAAMSPLRRRELHTAALELLKARGRGAAEIAHHALEAGAWAELVEFAVRAAQEAAALGAYREAMSHLGAALDHGAGLPAETRMRLLERRAFAAYFCGAFQVATAALEQAIALHRNAADVAGLGEALRIAAHVHWNLGDTALGERFAGEAVQVLSALPDTAAYAMALASKAQFDMLADRNALAVPAAEQARALAMRLGRWDIALQAQTYLATASASTDAAAGVPMLRATIAEARERGELDVLPRLYANLTSVMASARLFEGFEPTAAEGLVACGARDQAPLEAWIRGNRASVLIDQGRLEAGLAEAEDVFHGPYPRASAILPAMLALSRARTRLGQPEGGLLQSARVYPTTARDLLWRIPIAVADAEAEWLDGTKPDAAKALAQVLEDLVQAWAQLWRLDDVVLWLTLLGQPPQLSELATAQLSAACSAFVAGDWRTAAALWAARGCPYEQAIALSAGDEAAQRQALTLFDGLGAVPAARNLRRRLRSEGVRAVPSGPRSARRANPAGLTARQADVLALLVEGLANAEIAERLGLSAKTVEHHVSAVLAALEAPSRLAAAQIARERGLVSDETP